MILLQAMIIENKLCGFLPNAKFGLLGSRGLLWPRATYSRRIVIIVPTGRLSLRLAVYYCINTYLGNNIQLSLLSKTGYKSNQIS